MNTFWKFVKGILLRGESSDPSENLEGSLWYNSTSDRFKGYGESAVREFTTNDQTQTLTNKTLTNPAINGATLDNNTVLTIQDDNFTIQDDGDNTKQLQFQLSGISTATTRTLTVPNANTTIVGTDTTQTLTNKTLTDPDITMFDNNFRLKDNGDATKQLQFNASGISTGNTRILSAPDTSDTIAVLNLAQTFSNKVLNNTNSVTLLDNAFVLQDNVDPTKQANFQLSGISAGTNRQFSLPDISGSTIVTDSATQTLINKTIDGDNNTIQDVSITSLKTDAGAPNTFISRDGSGVVISTKAVPTGTVVGNSDSQTLTNKTISNASNTINGFSNNHAIISSGTGQLTSEAQLAITRGGTGQSTSTAAFDALSPLTTKGDIIVRDSSNNIRFPIGTNGQVLTADSAQTSGLVWSTPAVSKTQSYEISNLSLNYTVSSNALTITVKDAAGNAPSAGSPVVIGVRTSTTLTTETYTTISTTSATAGFTITIPSTATLGHANGVASPIYIYAFPQASGIEIGVSTSFFKDHSLVNTVALSTGSTSNRVVYSTTARTNRPIRLIGMAMSTQTTAGTWATTPQEVYLNPIERVTPYIAVSNSTTAIGTSFTDVVFSTKGVDTHNAYNTSTGIFTAPESGRYLISFHTLSNTNVSASSTNSSIVGQIEVNGTGVGRTGNFTYQVTGVTFNPAIEGSKIVTVSAGDTINLAILRTANVGSMSLDAVSNMQIIKVGEI